MNTENVTMESFQACDSITVMPQTSISQVLLRATLCLEYFPKDLCSAGFSLSKQQDWFDLDYA
jgi:hypothetical protein